MIWYHCLVLCLVCKSQITLLTFCTFVSIQGDHRGRDLKRGRLIPVWPHTRSLGSFGQVVRTHLPLWKMRVGWLHTCIVPASVGVGGINLHPVPMA